MCGQENLVVFLFSRQAREIVLKYEGRLTRTRGYQTAGADVRTHQQCTVLHDHWPQLWHFEPPDLYTLYIVSTIVSLIIHILYNRLYSYSNCFAVGKGVLKHQCKWHWEMPPYTLRKKGSKRVFHRKEMSYQQPLMFEKPFPAWEASWRAVISAAISFWKTPFKKSFFLFCLHVVWLLRFVKGKKLNSLWKVKTGA